MDTNSIATVLRGLQWNEEDAAIYLALLQLGEQPASIVARHLGRNRVTIFHALERMVKKGLARKTIHRTGSRFHATEPSTLLRRMRDEKDERMMAAEFHMKTLASIIPQLESIRSSDVVRPNVQTYYGDSALKEIYALSLLGKEMFAYFAPWSAATDKNLLEIDDWHTRERVARKIPVQIITPDTPDGVAFSHVKTDLKEIRVVPRQLFPHTDITLVTDRHLLMFSRGDHVGVAIDSAYIASNQRAIFALAWQGATNISTRK